MKPEDCYAPPADPETRMCEFCDDTAAEAITLQDGKLYLYTCLEHLRHGELSVETRPRPRRTPCPESEKLFDPVRLG